jgi:hypothetical protein
MITTGILGMPPKTLITRAGDNLDAREGIPFW